MSFSVLCTCKVVAVYAQDQKTYKELFTTERGRQMRKMEERQGTDF